MRIVKIFYRKCFIEELSPISNWSCKISRIRYSENRGKIKINHFKKTVDKRKIAVYLMKRHTGAKNEQIGELFGGMSFRRGENKQEVFTGG
ncbi:MAG: hypothetical protein Q7J31_19475 [Syntrophales bacterium]|nr:hypothetical protein [Syntrophales bacterium]